MAQPDIQSGKSTAKPRNDTAPAGAAEARAFDDTAANVASDGPAELLGADIEPRHGPNSAPEVGPDGTATFRNTSAGSGALKSAANEFRSVVSDVLKGKAGSAKTLAADAYEQLRGKGGQSLTKADELVRKRPYAALGAALVFGMLFANLTRRRR
jgi:ElaB/YqjD/DUF883 family membrane-anchored ribosome-binding protein